MNGNSRDDERDDRNADAPRVAPSFDEERHRAGDAEDPRGDLPPEGNLRFLEQGRHPYLRRKAAVMSARTTAMTAAGAANERRRSGSVTSGRFVSSPMASGIDARSCALQRTYITLRSSPSSASPPARR